ncbi:MAG: DEAD/DEAH box helicase [Thermoplasmatales archaeon]|nr:MAG: DEAD/DEAH box helicase [Thermoplasmatales archaeon]
MYIQQDFIKSESIERREYQFNIARSAIKNNTLVVLPTGLGKTIIGLLLVAKELGGENNKIIFLAPTKPLVLQHAQSLRQLLTIDEELIAIFTGEISPKKRKEIWNKSKIIVSTPQVIENDLLSKKLNLKDVSLIIFDEAHHAVGEYAYVFISEMYQKQREKRSILGITASPGNDASKILEVCKNLDIKNIEIRTKYDPDVKPYVHDLKINWKEIPLPKEFAYTIQLLRKALSERLKLLKSVDAVESSSVSSINRTKLLEAQKKIQAEIRSMQKPSKMLFKAASIQSEAMKIHFALELLQTQGVNTLKNYFQRMGKEAIARGSSKASRAITSDGSILEAIAYVKSLNIEHPKLQEIVKIVKEQIAKKPDSKIIVFTHYRDTSTYVVNLLDDIDNVRPVRFIGQAKKGEDKGLSQKQQTEVIKKFKEGKYNVLIATSVAEEGLDIPSTDLVVFYEPIPSEIRVIQRRGRTGRKMPGKVIILITTGTSDEGYYWAAKRKEKRMRSELELLRSKLSKKFEDAKSIYNEETKKKNSQKNLKDFEKQDNKLKIIVDHREYRSNVVRNLAIKGTFVEPQQLDVGDYVLSSRIGIERKSVDDFLESLTGGKLFKQVAKLRDAYSRPMLILEGEGILTKRNISHNAIFGSLASITVDFGIPILVTKDSSETADLLHVIASREQREDKKLVAVRGEKTAMSKKERQQFIMEGLPNVSSVIAKRLLNHFGSIRDVANASEEELREVAGIGKNIATGIIEILNAQYLDE